jgi:alpha-L-rhamnosidase
MNFSKRARWIWHDGDPAAYHDYVRFRREFSIRPEQLRKLRRGGRVFLRLTAESLYQGWVNGRVFGHGPAKSAEGRRSVDAYDITSFLTEGENSIELLVLGIGVGTMTTCAGEAGLIFQIEGLGRPILSDASTLLRREASRSHKTVRRWVLPCLEDVDMTAPESRWIPATVVERSVRIYPRRVPLPSREALFPQRLIAAGQVALPNFSMSFRLKPYLASGTQQRRSNILVAPAYLVTDIVSPVAQQLEFVPALGNVIWFFNGRRLFEGSGWTGWDPAQARPVIRLKKGANRLVGAHDKSHFEDINLCGFVKEPVELVNPFGAGGFQVFPARRVPQRRLHDPNAPTGVEAPDGEEADVTTLDWAAMDRPDMDPAHTMPEANAQDLARNARLVRELTISWDSAVLTLPAAEPGMAARVILDLDVLHNGWLAFEAIGGAGSRLLVSFFEGLDPGPPLRVQWPAGSNNALSLRIRGGLQSFESFLPYGVRYIALYHTGSTPLELRGLRVLTANCGSRPRGFLQTSDALLNGIYRVGAQSVVSATDDTFTDCPTFEQVNWNFDNRMCLLTDALTCANTPVAANSLLLFAEDPDYPGLARSQYPSAWDNRIPLWSFHWIMACRDHHWMTGDLQFVESVFPQVASGIEEALAMINPEGLLEWNTPDAWHFVEWGHGRDDDHPICGGEQAGLLGALDAACALAALVDKKWIARWRRARGRLASAVRRWMWNEKRQAFTDSILADGSQSDASSQVTNAMMALYGAGTEDWARQVAQRIHQGDRQLLPYGSPCGAYYVLELFDQIGMVDELFAVLRSRWGEIVLAGDTTTWEHFGEFGNAGWPTRSRCHPYSSYVVKYLVKYLLGIEAMAPGFRRVRVRPNPPAELEECHGAIPTPHGLVRCGWVRENGKLTLNVEAPAGVRVSR